MTTYIVLPHCLRRVDERGLHASDHAQADLPHHNLEAAPVRAASFSSPGARPAPPDAPTSWAHPPAGGEEHLARGLIALNEREDDDNSQREQARRDPQREEERQASRRVRRHKGLGPQHPRFLHLHFVASEFLMHERYPALKLEILSTKH